MSLWEPFRTGAQDMCHDYDSQLRCWEKLGDLKKHGVVAKRCKWFEKPVWPASGNQFDLNKHTIK
jgi:hypothetical protein